jgi:hypothetical protein
MAAAAHGHRRGDTARQGGQRAFRLGFLPVADEALTMTTPKITLASTVSPRPAVIVPAAISTRTSGWVNCARKRARPVCRAFGQAVGAVPVEARRLRFVEPAGAIDTQLAGGRFVDWACQASDAGRSA